MAGERPQMQFEDWIVRIESEIASEVEPEAWRRHYEAGLAPAEAVAADRAETSGPARR